MYVLWFSQQPVIQSTSPLADVLLKIQKNPVLSWDLRDLFISSALWEGTP